MKTGWTTKPLSEVIVKTETIDPRKNPKETFKYVDVSSISNQTFEIVESTEMLGKDAPSRARRSIQDGDVLFATIRPTLRRIAVVPEELDGQVCSTGYFVFRTKPEVEGRYLFYYLFSDAFMGAMEVLQSGASYPAVNDSQVRQQHISFPPFPEQKRIVAILDEAFAGIDAAVANTEKNLANARELFESYLNAVFTQKGDGWVEKSIAEVCALKSGTTVPKATERENGEIPYVKVAAMSLDENQRHITTSTRFLNASDVSPAKVFPVGTTIFPKRGGAIATNKKRLTAVPICADLNVMGVIPGNDLVPEFLYHYFLKFDLSTIGSGASIPQINNYDIAPLVIHYPVSKSDQQKIIAALKNLSEKTERLESIYHQKLEALAELKQSILQKAFAGELTTHPETTVAEEVA